MNYQVALTISYIFRLVNEFGNYHSINYSRLRCMGNTFQAVPVSSGLAVPPRSGYAQPASSGNMNFKINVVKVQDKFYIQDYKQNLQFIQEDNANKLPHNFIKNLNTLIYFEKYKKRPIQSMFYFKTDDQNSRYKSCIDFDLLSKLQLQFATDSSYFDS